MSLLLEAKSSSVVMDAPERLYAAEELEFQIRERTAGRVKNLRVYRSDDGVVLQGSSHTFYAKQLAQHAALQLVPRGRLLNEIVVVPCD